MSEQEKDIDNMTIRERHRQEAYDSMNSMPPLAVAKAFASLMLKTIPKQLEKTDPDFALKVKELIKDPRFIFSMERIIEDQGVEGLLSEIQELDYEDNPDRVIEFFSGLPSEAFYDYLEVGDDYWDEDKFTEEDEYGGTEDNDEDEEDDAPHFVNPLDKINAQRMQGLI